MEPRGPEETTGAGDASVSAGRVRQLLVELVDLEEVLEEIEASEATASPLFSDYALSVAAVLPVRHLHDKVPWAHVEGTASDGRDGLRLRACAIGTSVALCRAVDAISVPDVVLRAALVRVVESAGAWGAARGEGRPERLADTWRRVEVLMAPLDRHACDDEDVFTRLRRGVTNIVRGTVVGERVVAQPSDANAAIVAISNFAQAVHHAAAAASVEPGVLDEVVSAAVQGLVAMAAVA